MFYKHNWVVSWKIVEFTMKKISTAEKYKESYFFFHVLKHYYCTNETFIDFSNSKIDSTNKATTKLNIGFFSTN